MSPEPVCQPGDLITIRGRVRKVFGPGPHMALIETIGGQVTVPLPQPSQLPDEGIVVTHAPNNVRVHLVGAEGGCASCGR